MKVYSYFKQRLIKRYEWLKVALMANPFVTAIAFIVIVWGITAACVLRFEASAEGHNINSFEDAIWWGIVTLLTVGYGDKFPVTTYGRLVAGTLMVSGVVGIAIVTAKISSFFLERALRERRGFVDTSLLKNHFVICGWKDEMSSFLNHILDTNPHQAAKDIVLLNNAPDSEIENLLQVPRFKNIKVIRGDFYVEIYLKRAAPERASKVLILADKTPNAQGQIPTMSEADARTVMTAMTLNNIAKGTPVAAEVLDSSMDQYLRLAQVHEIIYSREYSRMLLALASSGIGVTNIYHELLNPHSPHFIRTKELPEGCLGQTYEKLQLMFMKDRPKEILIGLLENSGNSHVAKEMAIRKAQQTPNVAELVSNLTKVKALRFNEPFFGPPQNYIIKEGAMAIVIEKG